MAVVDSRTAPLQFNFLNHGTVHLLSNKLYNKLKSSDEGLFHDYILPLIPLDLVSRLYSTRTDVRPAPYAVNIVAAAWVDKLCKRKEEEKPV